MRMASAFISGVFTAGLAALRGGGGENQDGSINTPAATSVILAQGGVMRKSWRMDNAGRISDLNLVEEPLAAPGPGEARIKVRFVKLGWGRLCFSCWSAAGKEGPWKETVQRKLAEMEED
jgi:hypothetical protein